MKTPSIRPVIAPIALALVTVSMAVGTASAQSNPSLRDRVKEAGFDWMTGAWKAYNDDGQTVHITYEWDLKGHLLRTRYKDQNVEAIGITLYRKEKDKAVYGSADDRGNIGTGEWDEVDGKAVLKYETKNENGDPVRMGFAHSKVDADTMKVEIHGIENGELSANPWQTLSFKRQKKE